MVIALLDAHLNDLTENYFNTPLYGRAQLGEAFERIGRTVLGGWIHETNDTIDSHIDVTLKTLASKQHDYGHDNITRWGIRGICVRMADKHARLENLYRRGVRNALFETIEDTWLDLLGYSIIALMLIDETFTLPLERDI